MVDEGGCENDHARKAAAIVLRKFALAPKSFETVVRDIVEKHTEAPHV